MEKQEKEKFTCRVCGCNEYKEVRKHNGILGPGGRSWRVYCFCKNCSIVFIDPNKFSVTEQK